MLLSVHTDGFSGNNLFFIDRRLNVLRKQKSNFQSILDEMDYQYPTLSRPNRVGQVVQSMVKLNLGWCNIFLLNIFHKYKN